MPFSRGIATYVFLFSLVVTIRLVGARSIHKDKDMARDSNKTYKLKHRYKSKDFLTGWEFFTASDPTKGNVNYQGQNDAVAQGLAYVNRSDHTFILSVDAASDVPVGGYRKSVRIQSKNAYTGGLFVLDAAKMPVGCGVWPSFWSTGPNWPHAGEIDVVEGVNNQAHNQMTLHSGTNHCTLDTKGAFTGHALRADCYSTQNSDGGCAITEADGRSFGPAFNAAGGGLFALLWDPSTGIKMWHFGRASAPKDVAQKRCKPGKWGEPSGFWSAATCDLSADFYDHAFIIDTTICGAWAADAYSQSGCPGTCSEMVADKKNFVDAKWVINYVAVYQ